MRLGEAWDVRRVSSNLPKVRNIIPIETIGSSDLTQPIQEGQYRIERGDRIICSPEITENLELNHFMFRLFQAGQIDLKWLAYAALLQDPDYSGFLRDINIWPFVNLTSESQQIPSQPSELVEGYRSHVNDILEHRVLWRNSHAKLWYLRKISGESDIQELHANLSKLARHLVERHEMIPSEQVRQKISETIDLLKVFEYHFQSSGLTYDQWARVYADEIFLSKGNQLTMEVEGNELSVHFVPRKPNYLLAGSDYGDCTSLQRVSQVDDVKNIFWTKASWIFDPLYQILEIRHGREPLLKLHIFVGYFRGEIILCIDAVEAAVSMREFKSNSYDETKRNSNLSHLYPLRNEILSSGLELVRDMATRMNIKTVLMEEYSNATWVREYIGQHPETSFRMNELNIPYDGDLAHAAFVRAVGKSPENSRVEIQLRNDTLWDKWLRPGFNLARILSGDPIRSVETHLRGI